MHTWRSTHGGKQQEMNSCQYTERSFEYGVSKMELWSNATRDATGFCLLPAYGQSLQDHSSRRSEKDWKPHSSWKAVRMAHHLF
jgi:hypothetical protein